jgi:DNA-binding GntR family transcriptional regulator
MVSQIGIQSAPAQIHTALRDAILGLELGPGERLSERALETRFRLSRTPVRAALLRLEGEELVRRDGRGWIVAPIDLGEITALAEFREPLECAAVRLACTRAELADLDAIAAMMEGEEDRRREDWHRIGTDFHVEIARLSGNPFFAKAVASAMTRLARPRWLELRSDESREAAFAEHRRILDAVRRNDPDEAARAAALHIRATRDRLLASLAADRRGLRARGFAIVGDAA